MTLPIQATHAIPRPLPPNPLSIDPLRRLAARLALAAALAVLALALGASPQAQARAHSSSCRHSSPARHGSHRHACVKASHKSKGASRRITKHPRPARRRRKVAISAHPTGATTVSSQEDTATCEDGSDPLHVGDETFECEDGSEPRCEAGSTLALSDDGQTLLCSAVLPSTPGAGEAGCEEGPSPCPAEPATPSCSESLAPRADGASPPPCEDAGEPVCEEGSRAVGSSEDPTPVCVATGGEGDEPPAGTSQRPAAPSSHVASGS